MPCNTVTTQSLSIGLANAMPTVLAQALKELGFQLYRETDGLIRGSTGIGDSVEWVKGKGITLRTELNAEQVGGMIRRAYSRAAVSWASQRAGFKQVGQWQGNKVTLQRG